MKNNKLYLQTDAIARHEDFDVWYEDGTHALTFKGPWQSESDKVAIFGRMGGESGHIKPDHNTLSYYMRLERYEYVLHTVHIFKHYSVNGMLWRAYGTLSELPLDFVHEETGANEVHVRYVDHFKDKGPCYEIKVRDVVNLRIAAISVVGIALKEEYKGKSEGEEPENATRLAKIKRFFTPRHGIPYEKLQEEE